MLAQSKDLPDDQYLDTATIDWIGRNAPTYAASWYPDRTLLNHLSKVYDELKSHLPLTNETFLRGAVASTSMHGQLHAYRVALFAGILASLSGAKNLEPYILAGLYHDIARKNDKEDTGHGSRSAQRAVELGIIRDDLNKTDIIEAIACHDDESGTYQNDTFVNIVKAADALDRFRLPKTKWWPDSKKMPLAPTNEIFALAYNLVLLTEKEAIRGLDTEIALYVAMEKLMEMKV